MATYPLIKPTDYQAIVTFCAEEVGRQYKGHPDAQEAAQAVGWMFNAWMLAIEDERWKRPITVAMIREWGKLIEPEVNRDGFRQHKIWVGTHQGMNPWHIPTEMEGFVRKLPDLAHDPDQAYYQFELIHPFGDGNGRTGKVLFNYMKGTLRAPEMPYNFFGCANP